MQELRTQKANWMQLSCVLGPYKPDNRLLTNCTKAFSSTGYAYLRMFPSPNIDGNYLSNIEFARTNHLAYSLLVHSSSALTSSSIICTTQTKLAESCAELDLKPNMYQCKILRLNYIHKSLENVGEFDHTFFFLDDYQPIQPMKISCNHNLLMSLCTQWTKSTHFNVMCVCLEN